MRAAASTQLNTRFNAISNRLLPQGKTLKREPANDARALANINHRRTEWIGLYRFIGTYKEDEDFYPKKVIDWMCEKKPTVNEFTLADIAKAAQDYNEDPTIKTAAVAENERNRPQAAVAAAPVAPTPTPPTPPTS